MALAPVVVTVSADTAKLIEGMKGAIAQIQSVAKVVESMEGTLKSLESSMGSVANKAQGFGSSLGGMAVGAAAAAAGVAALGTKIIEMGNEVDPKGALEWAQSVGKFEDAAANAAAALASQLRPAFEAVMGVATKVLSYISTINFGKVVSDIGNVLSTIWGGLTSFAEKAAGWATTLAKWLMTPYQAMKDGFFSVMTEMLDKMADVADKAKEYGFGSGGGTLRIAAESVKSAGEGNLVDGMVAGLKTSLATVTGVFLTNAAGIGQALSDRYATNAPGKGHVQSGLDTARAAERANLLELEKQATQLQLFADKSHEQSALAASNMAKEAAKFSTDQAVQQFDLAKQKLSQANYSEFDAAMKQLQTAQKVVDMRKAAEDAIAAKELETARQYAATLTASAAKAADDAAKANAAAQALVAQGPAVTKKQQADIEAAKKQAELAFGNAKMLESKALESQTKVNELELSAAKELDAQKLKATQERIDLEKAASEHAKAMQTYMGGLGQKVLGGLGSAGSLIQTGMEGFTAAGPAGAIAGVAAGLLMQSKQFAAIVASLNTLVQKLADTLGQVLTPFQAVFDAANGFAPLLNLLGPALSKLAYLLPDGIGAAIEFANELAPFVKALQPLGDLFSKASGLLQGIPSMANLLPINMLKNLALNLAQDLGALVTAVSPLTDLMGKATDGLKSFVSSLNPVTAAIAVVNGVSKGMADTIGYIGTGFDRLQKAFDPVKDVTNMLIQVFRDVFGPSIFKVGNELAQVGGILEGALRPMLAQFKSFIEPILSEMSGPFNSAMQGLFNAIKLGAMSALQVAIEMGDTWDTTLAMLAAAVQAAGTASLGVAKGIAGVWNSVLEGIAGIISDLNKNLFGNKNNFLTDLFNKLWGNGGPGMQIQTSAIDQAMTNVNKGLASVTVDTTPLHNAFGQLANMTWATADAQDHLKKTINDTMGSLTNVPEGFKLALDTFDAIGAGQLTNESNTGTIDPNQDPTQTRAFHHGPFGGGSSSGGVVINIYGLQISANDPSEMLDKLEEAARRRNLNLTGSIGRFNGSPMSTR